TPDERRGWTWTGARRRLAARLSIHDAQLVSLPPMSKHVVARVDEIPPGQRKIVDVAGRSIGVFNLNGEFFALRNRCPHQGGPLCEGRLRGAIEAVVPGEITFSRAGEILTCGWHGGEFDIRTGQSWGDPSRLPVRRYEVRVAS